MVRSKRKAKAVVNGTLATSDQKRTLLAPFGVAAGFLRVCAWVCFVVSMKLPMMYTSKKLHASMSDEFLTFR